MNEQDENRNQETRKTNMLKIEPHDKIALVRMTNGVTNPISPEMLECLEQTIEDVRANYRGMVLAGGSKFFSIGLDLPRLLEFDRASMTGFWTRFEEFALALCSIPVPTAAAINGHATGGGMILSLGCDYRLVSPGRKFLGLNEVKIGLGVPFSAHLMLEQVTGALKARDMELEGNFHSPESALEVNLVDGIEEDVEKAALEKIAQLAELPPAGFIYTKENRTKPLVHRFQQHRETRLKEIIETWFEPSVQKILSEAAKKF